MAQDEEAPLDISPHQDYFLEYLVDLANAGGSFVSVSLTVGGNIVVGELIGGAEYFEAQAKKLEEAFTRHKRLASTLGETVRQFGKDYDDGEEEEEEEEGPLYIHLQGVTIYAGQTKFSFPFWRGRISAVDGFEIGGANP